MRVREAPARTEHEKARPVADTVRGTALATLTAAAILGTLVLLQGTDRPAAEQAAEPAAAEPPVALPPHHAELASTPGVDGEASFVRRDTWSLLLPADWMPTEPIAGEAFRARSEGGETILWVKHDPELSLPRFVRRSLAELRELDPGARITHSEGGPTAESRIVQLRAAVPDADGSPYLVTLRSGGPFRYYLASAVDSDASPAVRDGAARIHGSFTPEAG